MPENRTGVLITPTGELREVPSNQILDALKQGWKKAPKEMVEEADNRATYGEGAENMVKTFLTSAASGATFGASTAIGVETGLLDPETVKMREEYNPGSAMAGEVAGIVGSLLIPGATPIKGMLKGSQAIERGLMAALPEATGTASKVLASGVSKFAGSAIEGAAFGAGQLVHESALGDPDMTAQSAMAHIGLSALLGGVLGSAMGVVEKTAGVGMSRIGKHYDDLLEGMEKKLAKMDPVEADTVIKNSVADDIIEEIKTKSTIGDKMPKSELRDEMLDLMGRSAGKEFTPIESKSVMKAIKNISEGKLGSFAMGMGANALGVPPLVAGAGKLIFDHISNPTEIMKRLVGYDSMIRATGKALETGVKKVFDYSPVIAGYAASKHDILTPKEYNRITTRLNQLTNDPNALVDKLQKSTVDLYDYAPMNSQMLQKNSVRALEFLKTKLPQAPAKGPLDGPWVPSKRDINTFSKYWGAVESPISVLKHVRAGTVSKEQVETLKTVYPSLYKAMAMELMNKIASKNNKIPYKTRMAISTFLEQPMERSMEGPSIAHNQAALTQVSQPPKSGGTPKKVNSSAKIEVAGRYQTPFQRANSRDA